MSQNLSADNHSKRLSATLRGGSDLCNIEEICKTSKIEFLKKTYDLAKIKDRKDEYGFKSLVGAVLTKINGLMGFKGEIDSLVKQDLMKMILSYFKELSIEEVYKAFELERFGEYEAKTDHFQLFDANYVSEVLKKYRKWKIEQKRVFNISAPKIEKTIDKVEIRKEYLKTVFSELKTEGFSSDAYHLYDQLEYEINATNEYKKELYQKQLKVYEIEEKEYISTRGVQIKAMLQDLKNKIENKSGVESVKNKCKSILVSDHLKQNLESEDEFIKKLF